MFCVDVHSLSLLLLCYALELNFGLEYKSVLLSTSTAALCVRVYTDTSLCSRLREVRLFRLPGLLHGAADTQRRRGLHEVLQVRHVRPPVVQFRLSDWNSPRNRMHYNLVGASTDGLTIIVLVFAEVFCPWLYIFDIDMFSFFIQRIYSYLYQYSWHFLPHSLSSQLRCLAYSFILP